MENFRASSPATAKNSGMQGNASQGFCKPLILSGNGFTPLLTCYLAAGYAAIPEKQFILITDYGMGQLVDFFKVYAIKNTICTNFS